MKFLEWRIVFEELPKQFPFWCHLCKYRAISHWIVTVEKLFRGLFATQDFVILSALESV